MRRHGGHRVGGYSRRMLRPLSLLPALVAVAATTWRRGTSRGRRSSGAASVAERAVATSRSNARAATTARVRARAARDPLEVSIAGLTPSYLPEKGPIEITGTVTNVSPDPFTAVNLHAFVAEQPDHDQRRARRCDRRDAAEFVGDRITTPGTFDHIDMLEPGESELFRIRVPRKELLVSAPGVYWFGVHALGDSVEPRDDTCRRPSPHVHPAAAAEDRSRSTPPWSSHSGTRSGTPATAASLDEERVGRPTLSSGGALRTLVDFGASAGSRPVTWLVDPAVPEAVRRLVAGNPPRSLEDTVPSGEPGEGESPIRESHRRTNRRRVRRRGARTSRSRRRIAATEPGTAWLDRCEDAMAGDEILALPYGDVDVSAAAEQRPRDVRRGTPAQRPDLEPGGFTDQPRRLLAERIRRPRGAAGDPRRLDDPGHRRGCSRRRRTAPSPGSTAADLFPTSWSPRRAARAPATRCPPSPCASRSSARPPSALLYPERPPLLVVMPQTWDPDSTLGFFGGLDVDWLNLVDIGEATSRRGVGLEADDLEYPGDPGPPRARRRELLGGNGPRRHRRDPPERADPQRHRGRLGRRTSR